MLILLDLVYLMALAVALPFLVRKSFRTGKYRSGWAGRFGRGEEVLPRRGPGVRMLLMHCVSVGELLSVETLIKQLLAADDRLHITVSTGTDTGTARAAAMYPPTAHGRVHTARFPLDFSFAMEAFFDRVRPDAIALVELETWPGFLTIAKSRRIPVAIINGRISEKSFPRYRRIRPLMRSMLGHIDWIGAQTPAIAQRFLELGAPTARIHTLPTLKYDNAPQGQDVAGSTKLAQAMGLSGAHRLFVAGSTGPGEEIPILESYLALRTQFPDLRLAIVPRHPEVVAQVIRAIEERGLTAIRRTAAPDNPAALPHFPASHVFVLDTMGELRKMYALAFAVFVGRSFIKKGGSDMIEVAALGKPCCFGPFTANFAEVVEALLAESGAAVVADGGELRGLLEQWLREPARAAAMGERGRQAVLKRRGSTERYVVELLKMARGRGVAQSAPGTLNE